MFKDAIIKILNETYPMILICCEIIIVMRLVYLFKNKEKINIFQDLLYLIFAIYVMCLFYVVTFQDVSWSTSNFIPFKEMFRYELGTPLFFKNVIGNTLMFVPYGFFITYFLKLKNILSILLLTLSTSLTIEITQLLIGRVFDIDDIILNVIGSLFGYLLVRIVEKLSKYLPNWLKKPLIYCIIVLILFALLLIGR